MYAALKTCRNWLHVIGSEPRFWHTLTLPLHAVRCGGRAARFAKHVRLCPDKAQLRRVEISHSGSPIDETMADHLYDECYRVIQALRVCSSGLTDVTMRIGGRSFNHLALLRLFLPELLSYPEEQFPRAFANARSLHIDMPDVYGFELDGGIFCMFEKLESLRISSCPPFEWAMVEAPRRPSCTPLLHMWLQSQSQVKLPLVPPQPLRREFDGWLRAQRQYAFEMQIFQIQQQQRELKEVWEEMAVPTDEEDREIAFSGLPSPLRHLELQGCYLRPSLVLPDGMFPALTSCVLVTCKWGLGIYRFLQTAPNLARLDIQAMIRDEEEEEAQRFLRRRSAAPSDTGTLVHMDEQPEEVAEIHLTPVAEPRRVLSLRGGGGGYEDDIASDSHLSEFTSSIDSADGFLVTNLRGHTRDGAAQGSRPMLSAEAAPPVIMLHRLVDLTLAGPHTPLIWCNIETGEPPDPVPAPLHPVATMPNLRSVDLGSNYSLDLRTTGPVGDDRLVAQALREVDGMSDWQWDDLLNDFHKNKEPVPFEPTDQELLRTMSKADYEYYVDHLWKIRDYRRDWRTQMGYFRKDGWVDEDMLWELVTGQHAEQPKPHALAVLAAGCPKLARLDLAHSNISRSAFKEAMPFLQSLEVLSLRGTEDVDGWALKELPSTCPSLTEIDVRASGVTVGGVAPLVHRIREGSDGRIRLKVRVDEPAFDDCMPANLKGASQRVYEYLRFVDALIDEELEAWKEAQRTGKRLSTREAKQRMQSAR